MTNENAQTTSHVSLLTLGMALQLVLLRDKHSGKQPFRTSHFWNADGLLCLLAGAGFLMWELSTPFVYLRWSLHNLGYAKSPLYVANGFAMLISFFLARNVFGNCKLS